MREKLIELLKSADDLPVVETYESFADYLIDNGVTFETGTNVGDKWISVKDRLPEMHEAVLVYTLTHDVLKAHFRGERSFFGHDGIWRSVTHWRPLPEPPSESTVTVEDECNDEDWGS